MDDPIAFKTKNYPDTINYHEVMREHHRGELIKAMVKEVDDHAKNNH